MHKILIHSYEVKFGARSEQCIKQHSEYTAKTEITLNCLLFCYIVHHKNLIDITLDVIHDIKNLR